ncbi:hypothetical protein VZT92_024114 [Zoarces viviparus]|uniref:Uncharacterized protein n=1 Tax=Zoarces viviparus TaxID=48416 RepID=A0AAW1E106_ZOAVI
MSRRGCMENSCSAAVRREKAHNCVSVFIQRPARRSGLWEPAASSRTLNKRISRVLGEPRRPQAVGVRTGAHARMCDNTLTPPPPTEPLPLS